MILIQVGNKMRWMKRILALCMAAVIAAGLSTPLTAEAAPVPVIRGGLHFYSWDEKDKTKCYIRMTRQNITAIEYRVYSSGGKLKKTASSVVARDPDSKYQICTVKGLTARSRNYVSVRIKNEQVSDHPLSSRRPGKELGERGETHIYPLLEKDQRRLFL